MDIDNENIPTIEGMQSFKECRESILKMAQNMVNDVSSTFFNHQRAVSMRALLDLFEQYNELIINDIKANQKFD